MIIFVHSPVVSCRQHNAEGRKSLPPRVVVFAFSVGLVVVAISGALLFFDDEIFPLPDDAEAW